MKSEYLDIKALQCRFEKLKEEILVEKKEVLKNTHIQKVKGNK